MVSSLKIDSSLKLFLDYLSSQKQFFGKDYLTTSSLFMYYLNYDEKNNVVRASLATTNKHDSLMTKMNKVLFDAVVSDTETCSTSQPQFGVDLKFSKELSERIDSIFSRPRATGITFDEFAEKIILDAKYLNPKISKLFGFKEDNSLMDISKKAVLENPSNAIYGVSIPKKLEKYLKVINGKNGFYDHSFRNEVYDIVWPHLQKRKRNNIAIVGSSGFGRKPFVYGLSHEIQKGNCPDSLKNKVFLELNCMDLIALEYDEKIKDIETINSIVEFMNKNPNYILFIDNIYMIFNLYLDGNKTFFHLIQTFLLGKFQSIITVDDDDLKVFEQESKLLKRFVMVSIGEPESKKLYSYLIPTIQQQTFYHGVYCSYDMYKKLELYANVFNPTGFSYNYMKDLTELAMVNAINHHRNELIEKDIFHNFALFFKEYEQQSDDIKKMNAVHEAGHFVVIRFSTIAKAFKVSYISVVGFDGMGGFNMISYDKAKQTNPTYEFYREYIAGDLGGRAAEELFIKKISSGAEMDLQQATKTANDMVANLSLKKGIFGKRRIQANENMKTEKSLNKVSKESNRILQEAYKLSIHILNEHQDYVLGLAQYLLDHKIVDVKELKDHEVKENGHIYWKD